MLLEEASARLCLEGEERDLLEGETGWTSEDSLSDASLIVGKPMEESLWRVDVVRRAAEVEIEDVSRSCECPAVEEAVEDSSKLEEIVSPPDRSERGDNEVSDAFKLLELVFDRLPLLEDSLEDDEALPELFEDVFWSLSSCCFQNENAEAKPLSLPFFCA